MLWLLSCDTIEHCFRGFSGFHSNLLYLLAAGNPISEFPPDFFSGFGKLVNFACTRCRLGPTLSTRSFTFNSESLQSIRLLENSISTVELDAIRGMNTSVHISGVEQEFNFSLPQGHSMSKTRKIRKLSRPSPVFFRKFC